MEFAVGGGDMLDAMDVDVSCKPDVDASTDEAAVDGCQARIVA